MKIVSSFPFFNKLDIFEIHLETVSDVVEIPRASLIQGDVRILRIKPRIVAHLAQAFFCNYLNPCETSGTLLSCMNEDAGVSKKKLLGTTIQACQEVGDSSISSLRNPEREANGVRIPHGEWHFSLVGSPERAPALERDTKKLENAAHQEFETVRNLSRMAKRNGHGKDLVGRHSARFLVDPDLGFLPDYVLANLDKFHFARRS